MDLFVRPNGSQVVRMFDDFIVFLNSGGTFLTDACTWITTQMTAPAEDSGGDNPGTFVTAGTSTSVMYATRRIASLSNGSFTCAWSFKIGTLSDVTNRYHIRIGMLGDAGAPNATGAFTDAIYFSYMDSVNTGQWVLHSEAANVDTTTNTSNAATTTGYHKFHFDATSVGVTFYIDHVSQGTITTNIPTVNMKPFFQLENVNGAAPASAVSIDYATFQYNLTTHRK